MKITNKTKLQTQAVQFIDFEKGGYSQTRKILANGKDTNVMQCVTGGKNIKSIIIYSFKGEIFKTINNAMEKAGHQYLRNIK